MEGQTLRLQLGRSRYLLIYLLLIHLMAALAILMTALVGWLTLLLLSALLLSFVVYQKRFIGSTRPQQLLLKPDGYVDLDYADGQRYQQLRLQQCYQSHYLLILYLQQPKRRLLLKLLVPADSLSVTDYRLLRRQLRDIRLYRQ